MYHYLFLLCTFLSLLFPVFINKIRKWKALRIIKGLKQDDKKQLEAFHKNDFLKFKELAENTEFNPNLRDPISKRTLLMMCAPHEEKLQFAEYIIQRGCDVNATDMRGLDMLFLTSYWKCEKLFDLVIKQKGLLLDRSNTVLTFPINPLASCIYKYGDYKKKPSINKPATNEGNNAENSQVPQVNIEEDEKAKRLSNPWYRKAGKLLQKGADPRICREIVERSASYFTKEHYQEFEGLLDVFERWHASKKVFLIHYYMIKEGKTSEYLPGERKLFSLNKLPLTVISKIADEFL